MRVLLGNIDLHVCVCLLNVMSGSSGSFDSPCTIQWRIQVLRLWGPTFLEIRIAPPHPPPPPPGLRGFPEVTIQIYSWIL